MPIGRRQFLRMAARSALGALATGALSDIDALAAEGRSRVVIATSPAIWMGDSLVADEIAALLDRGIVKLLDVARPVDAWKKLFDPRDTVAVKVNCLAGTAGLSSTVEVTRAVCAGITKAGVPPENIIVWDRTEREMTRAGFPIVSEKGKVRYIGTDSLPGNGYERKIESAGSVGTCFSHIISRMATAVVNIPVLKDHDVAGVTIGMKNFYGAIHNPNKYHDNACDPYIAELSTHPYIRDKLRLVVCDATRAQAHGGPGPAPRWVWREAALLLARDPVALDAVGADIIESKRREFRLPPLARQSREPKYIRTAQKLGLGMADLDRIDRIEVT